MCLFTSSVDFFSPSFIDSVVTETNVEEAFFKQAES